MGDHSPSAPQQLEDLVTVLDSVESLLTTISNTLVSGSTQYAEGATDASITGTAMMWEDTADTLRAVSAGYPLPVDIQAGGLISIEGTILVDGSAVTQPVSGTVTANLSATDNAVLDTIDAVLDAINAKLVTGTVIGDVNLGAVDNAVLDAIAASLAIIDATVFGAGTEAGALRVTLPTDGTGVVKLGAGTAEIGKLA